MPVFKVTGAVGIRYSWGDDCEYRGFIVLKDDSSIDADLNMRGLINDGEDGVDIELDTEIEAESAEKVEEKLANPDSWDISNIVGNVEGLVSMYVDEVDVSDLTIEEVTEEEEETPEE